MIAIAHGNQRRPSGRIALHETPDVVDRQGRHDFAPIGAVGCEPVASFTKVRSATAPGRREAVSGDGAEADALELNPLRSDGRATMSVSNRSPRSAHLASVVTETSAASAPMSVLNWRRCARAPRATDCRSVAAALVQHIAAMAASLPCRDRSDPERTSSMTTRSAPPRRTPTPAPLASTDFRLTKVKARAAPGSHRDRSTRRRHDTPMTRGLGNRYGQVVRPRGTTLSVTCRAPRVR